MSSSTLSTTAPPSLLQSPANILSDLALIDRRKPPANALDHFEPGLTLSDEMLKLFRADHADFHLCAIPINTE